MSIFDHDVFQSRHIGPDAADTADCSRIRFGQQTAASKVITGDSC